MHKTDYHSYFLHSKGWLLMVKIKNSDLNLKAGIFSSFSMKQALRYFKIIGRGCKSKLHPYEIELFSQMSKPKWEVDFSDLYFPTATTPLTHDSQG